jgi:LPXTG-site transpeptidase (sortase) family protein
VTIGQGTPTVTVTNTPVAYDGSPHAATVTCSGGGAASNILTGAAATQTDLGSYTVTADCAASTNYIAATGITAGNLFVIGQGTPTVTVTNTPVVYDGSPHAATVTCSGGGAASNILTGGAATQTDIGSYTVTADCAASTNYVAAAGITPTNHFVISNGTQTILFTSTAPANAIVDGSTYTPTATGGLSGNPVVFTIDLSASSVCSINLAGAVSFQSAGTCTIDANQAGNTNYSAAAQVQQSFLVKDIGPTIQSGGIEYVINTVPTVLDENAVVIVGINQFTVTFSRDINQAPSTDLVNYGKSVLNPANYMLVNSDGDGFQTVDCKTGVAPTDTAVTIDLVTYSNGVGGTGPFVATLTVNGGTPLSSGIYRLYVCGTTSITDLGGMKLAGDGITTGTDFVRNFVVQFSNGGGNTGATTLPATGFAPNRMTALPVQPADKAYSSMGSLWLEVPKLNLQMNIVGVPEANGSSWDVSWLGNNAGWLNGTAFPAHAGNSVITGHVWNADNTPGPFVAVNQLMWGDKVIIHDGSTQYVFEVRSVMQVSPANTAAMLVHEDQPWITLVTCRGFNSATGTYQYRVLVRAALVDVK